MLAYPFEIVKGSRPYHVNKGVTGYLDFEPVNDSGVRVHFGHSTQYIPPFWMAGNRKNAPSPKVGQEYNLHKGDPTRNIRVRITGPAVHVENGAMK